jgi:hypothetical protein
MSITDGELPDMWKKANITPLFKKGSRLLSSNYRPVSLTSIPCKIIEKIISVHIMKYLTDNNLLSKHQHGFVRGKNCTTNLLEYVDIITEGLACGNSLDVLYTDFAKAFDKVSHRKLLTKIKAYGINGEVLKWIECFLNDREQRVIMGNNLSDWCNVSSGVPQGSVLGPLLFLLFINDLPEQTTTSTSKLYADDNKIIAKVNNENDAKSLQREINSICEWSTKWSLNFNIEKCRIMHFGKQNNHFNYYMPIEGKDWQLSKTFTERDVGVYISDDLKWSNQINQAIAKANSKLGLILKTFTSRDKTLMKTLYCSYVRPQLEFAASVWNPYLEKDIQKLEKIQNRATKTIPELRHMLNEDRNRQLNLTSLRTRRLRGDLIQQLKFVFVRNSCICKF